MAKKIQETLNIPIIYVSANTNDNVYNRALSTNMNGYLSKPLSSEELENDIQEGSNNLEEQLKLIMKI